MQLPSIQSSVKFGLALLTTTLGSLVLLSAGRSIAVEAKGETNGQATLIAEVSRPEDSLTRPGNPQSATPVTTPTASPTASPAAAPATPLPPGSQKGADVSNGMTRAVPASTPVPARSLRVEFAPASNSRVPADGRSTVTLSGQIVDQTGAIVTEDVLVTLTSSAGKFVGADQDRDRAGFQVMARQGKFSIDLRSTLDAQKVKVRAAIDPPKSLSRERSSTGADQSRVPFPYPSTIADEAGSPYEAYAQVEFITNLRPSLVSGSLNLRVGAAGTDFYGRFRDFLRPDRIDDGTRFDFGASVFAIGQVGDWLFTGAFNNQRPLNEQCDGTTRLFRDAQFCDQTYPTYGDSSTTDFLTPSIDSVYAKFERTSPSGGQDYAMWGDYRTDEFSTASQYYTATARQLHGFKLNYNFGNFQATAMYGNNLEGFQRDTIAPNGTSGLYFLSRRLLIGGSESVFVETEELNRPGAVVERVPLSRIKDYEIDYDRGTLLFRRPIQTTDFDLFGRTLVRRIVVTYQYDSQGGGDTHLYAGRLQYNFSREFQKESWAGVTYLKEDQGLRDFELYGGDFMFRFGKDGQLVAEFARSRNQNSFVNPFADPLSRLAGEFVEGNAFRVEARTSLAPGVLARGYYRSVDEGFSNLATFSFAPGQTRYGAEVGAKVGPTTQVRAQVDREINYGFASAVRTGFDALFNTGVDPLPGTRVDNSLTTVSAGVEQKIGKSSLSVDWVNRNRADRAPGAVNLDSNSNQIVSRLNVPLTETLSFRAQNEANISSSDPIYPNRTTLGLDWKVDPSVTVRLAQQFSSGGQFKSNSITTLDTLVDRRLSDDTSLTGRYSVISGINGVTGQGAIGLNHRLKLSPGLRVNLGYERIFGDIFAYTAAGQQYAQPYAVGQSAASLGVSSGDSYNIGIDYSDSPDFKASGRFERRNSDLGNNTVWSLAAAGKVSPALTVLARFQQANASNQLLTGLPDSSNLKLGLAYRDPNDDKLNVLFRYEQRRNPGLSPNSLLFENLGGEKVNIMSLEALYAPNYRWEFYGKYALRNTQAAAGLDGTNFISLAQLRTTYRLGYNWDLGGEVRWLSQSLTGFKEMGFMLEAGYYLTPNLRVAGGYSFGDINNDRDFEGSRSKGGFYATVSLKLNELFNGFGLQRVAPAQQRESRQETVTTQPQTPTQSSTQSVMQPQSVLPTLTNVSAGNDQ